MAPPPADEYRTRLEARRAAHASLVERDLRYSRFRLTSFALFVLTAVLGLMGFFSTWWSLLPVIALAVLVVRHDAVVRARDAAARAVAFYDRGLARIEDRWIGSGATGERLTDDGHLYANDLDLFGRGSLFELLSIARTRAGEDTLAAWLKHPAVPDEARSRQRAVAELTDALDLREDISVVGREVTEIRSDSLTAWADAPPLLSPPWLRWLALTITAAVIATAVLWLTTDMSTPLMVMLALQVGFAWPQQKRVERVLHGADWVGRELDTFGHMLQRLEREQFSSPSLAALRSALDTKGVVASHAIRQLHRLVELHDWQHNLLFLMISLPLMWGTHVAWAIEDWRRAHGRHVRHWIDAVGQFEAFSSLSAYRFEHPDDPFPELVDASVSNHGGFFEGTALGHPLVPASRMVRNDVSFAGGTRLLVVSGSNMSGKSTLLRTVGINAVLAQAGAPVRAATLRLSPLAIGATLRIQDSLQEGRSRFFAEITRIRELSDMANGGIPLLFLLDELFHGTNSHDRLVGSSGVLRSFVDRGAIGLITTHDLALAGIARALAPRGVNVHFEDWFDGGEIRFDYRLKPGPVTRSNAIALMRAVGLDVPEA